MSAAFPITTQQVSVLGQYSDGTSDVLTSSAAGTTYQTSNPGIANVGPSGLVTFSQAGQVTITATNGSVHGQSAFSVTSFNPLFLGLYPGSNFTNVAVAGQTAYVTVGNAGLRVIDASNAQTPRLIGSAPVVGSGSMVDISISGSRAYVAETNDLAVFDISTATPTRVSTISGSSVLGVTVSGGLLYLTDGSTLRIYDAASLSSIGQLAGLPAAGAAVSVSEGLAYVAMGTAGLAIVDVSTPTAPALITTVPAASGGSNLVNVASQGRTACFPDGAQVACIYATNPANAAVVGQSNLSAFGPRGVAFSGNLLLVADFGFIGQLPVFNVSNPASPTFVSIVPLSTKRGGARIAVSGSFVYEIDNSGPVPGLYISLFAPQVPATPPTVSLTAPAAGTKVVEGAFVQVSASAADSVAVANVTYSVNGVAQSTATTLPNYNANVRIPVGTAGSSVQISAQAQNVSGLVSSVYSVSVNVVPDPLTTVQGRLTDVFGDPIANVTVSLADGLQTTSGPDGSFLVTHVPTAQGYELVSATATVSGFTLFANVHAPPVLAGITDFGTVVLNGNVTLSNSVSGTLVPILSPYQVAGAATINAGQTLTVPAGTIVKFAPGASLTVNGALIASGTATSPVTFTSLADDSIGGDTAGDGPTTGAAGQYVGVIFTNAAAATNLGYTTLRYGQANKVTSGLATFNNDTFTGMSVAPMQLSPGAMVAGQGNLATTNGVNGIDILGGGFNSGAQTWNNIGLPFVLRGSDMVASGSAVITIQPGVIVKLKGNVTQTAQLASNGFGLHVNGTPSQPVIFTSLLDDTVGGDTDGDNGVTQPAPGDWLSVIAGGPNVSSVSNAVFRYGGSAVTSNAMLQGNGGLVLSNVLITSAAARGLYSNAELDMANSSVTLCGSGQSTLLDTASTATITSVLWDSNRADAVWMQSSAQASFAGVTWSNNSGKALFVNNTGGSLKIATATFLNNGGGLSVNPQLPSWSVSGPVTFTNSGVAGMDLLTGSTGGSRNWPALPFPYVVRGGNITFSGTLTLNPGAVFKLSGTSGFASNGSGIMVANGTPAQPVVFTSLKDDSFLGDTNNDGSATRPAPGDWTLLNLNGTGLNSLNNVIVRYGGSGNSTMVTAGGSVAITGFDISSAAAIGLISQGSLNLTNGIVSANRGGTAGMLVSSTSSSTITNVQFLANTGDGLDQNDGSRLFLNQVQFSSNGAYGLASFNSNDGGGAPALLSISSAAFYSNGNAMIKLDPSIGQFLASGELHFGGRSGINGVDVKATGTGGARTWPALPFPYVVRGGNVTLGGTLTLSPGVVVKLLGSSGIATNGSGGILVANGTPSQPVVFTSLKDDSFLGDTNDDGAATSPAPGDWSLLNLGGTGLNSLNNVIVRFGGNGNSTMVVANGNVAITGFDISSAAAIGLQASGSLNLTNGIVTANRGGTAGMQARSTSSSTITNVQFLANTGDGLDQNDGSRLFLNQVQFSSNGGYGIASFNSNDGGGAPVTLALSTAAFYANGLGLIKLDPGVGQFTLNGELDYAGNRGVNGVDMTASSSGGARTWQALPIPYVVRKGNITINSTLTLSPGVVVKLQGDSITSGGSGTILAQGAPGGPVIFTSLKDDSVLGDTNNDASASSPAPGDWGGVSLSGPSNVWTHAAVRYGGSGGNGEVIAGSNITASNCEFSHSGGYGVDTGNSSAISITSSLIAQNVTGVRSNSPSSISVTQDSITGNTSFGVQDNGGIAVNATNNWWGDASGPNVSSNPGGAGDKVNAGVTFNPFLTSPPAGVGP